MLWASQEQDIGLRMLPALEAILSQSLCSTCGLVYLLLLALPLDAFQPWKPGGEARTPVLSPRDGPSLLPVGPSEGGAVGFDVSQPWALTSD